MRIQDFARGVLILLAITSPAMVFAQFQEPASEELKMTADPKAPDAAAVYFDVEQTTDDQLHFKSFYACAKVLTEKGRTRYCRDSYERGTFKVSDIKARTIPTPMEPSFRLGKPEDLLISKTIAKGGDLKQYNRKVFTLPSVEVGSILEYAYQIHYDDKWVSEPNWRIQQPYFIHRAHYAFKPLAMYAIDVAARGVSSDFAVDKDGKKPPFFFGLRFFL